MNRSDLPDSRGFLRVHPVLVQLRRGNCRKNQNDRDHDQKLNQ
jgi:hypothetical protein